jgi:hypothetical protein
MFSLSHSRIAIRIRDTTKQIKSAFAIRQTIFIEFYKCGMKCVYCSCLLTKKMYPRKNNCLNFLFWNISIFLKDWMSPSFRFKSNPLLLQNHTKKDRLKFLITCTVCTIDSVDQAHTLLGTFSYCFLYFWKIVISLQFW